jgi:anti-sigma-K factor RskA
VSPTHHAFEELAVVYAVGALDGQDLAVFQAHLAQGCAECERVLAEYGDALAAAAGDLREAPPPRVRQALMARVRSIDARAEAEARVRARSRSWAAFRWVASVAVAAGLIAAVVGGYVSSRYEARLGQMARDAAALRERLDQMAREAVTLGEQMAEQRQILALLHDPATRVVALAGLAPSPRAQARMIWHDQAGGMLLAAGLPPVPADKTYELWAIAAGKPIPAGLFTVDPEGKGKLQVMPLPGTPKVDVFAVTLEPAGGVPAPTGQMYLASSK